jgi:septum formation protein
MLLESVGLPFEVDAAEIDERGAETLFLGQGGAIEGLAAELARQKALQVSRRRPGALCVGADQTLCLDGRLFHKAESLEDAALHLAALSGKTHRLTSAIAVAIDGRLLHEADDHADMRMRNLNSNQIDLYLRLAGELALGSVGLYQIERLGPHLFKSIEGDHSSILGLPILKLLDWLRGEGALAL